MLTPGTDAKRRVARRAQTLARAGRWRRGEAGQAMLIVVSLVALISTVPMVVMATSVGQLSLTTENLNWNAAYEAAQAGLNDYIEHLDQNAAFDEWSTGNPNFKCTYSPATSWGYELVNGSWQWVNLKAPGFCGWAAVPGTGAANEAYEYSLPSTGQGALALTVSGRAGAGPATVTRTFTYDVVPTSSFLDNIYWTNYEMMDPTLNTACAQQDLLIPSSTPMNQWVDYASEYSSQGPAPAWSSGGTITSGSNQVTGVGSTTGLVVGDTVGDALGYLPQGTRVTAISGTTLTLSSAATAGSSTDTFYTTLTALPIQSAWSGTGKVTAGSNQITGVSSGGLSTGDVLSDSGGAFPGGPLVTNVSGNKVFVSENAAKTVSSDQLNAYIQAYSQSPWPPNTSNNCWIWFATGDVVNGPTFSNDTLRVDGSPTFYGQVFSAAKGRQDPFTGTSEPCEYLSGGGTVACQAGPAKGLPPQFLGDEPQPGTAADATAAQLVGCYISGGTLANPTPTWVDISMTVSGGTTLLKWSKDSRAANSPNVDNATANGGNPNNNGSKCGSSGGGSITVNSLASPLIYVNGNISIVAPSGGGADTDKGFLTLVAGDDDGVGPAEWGGSGSGAPSCSSPCAGDIYLLDSVEYPSSDVAVTTTNCSSAWSGGGGIPANECPHADQNDALGLVADYFIQYPQAPNVGFGGGGCPNPPFTVEAALLALTDSVYAQNWGSGGQCYLDVFGAIGQDFRGPVGLVQTSGYIKEYYYDTSLATLWPAYYLASTSSGWEPIGYAEGKPGSASRALASVPYASGCGSQC